MFRSVVALVKGKKKVDGAGVSLTRVLGPATIKAFDPFLLLDAFDSRNPKDYTAGFPMHPHRGIETVTYLLDGQINHEDSLGNRGKIENGGCQWMTAGSGIKHQEMPIASERLLGLQLWLNLPASHKMTKPRYRDLKAETIPAIIESGSTTMVVSGNYKGLPGAFQPAFVKTDFLELTLEPGRSWELETKPGDTVFIYIFSGELFSHGHNLALPTRHAILFGKGRKLGLKAGIKGALLAVFSAPPLGEPVAWEGPIVMNTAEELKTAFQELEDGKFIKSKPGGI